MRKLSLCITTYNRFELTMKCIEDVIDDIWVDEIVIVDDCSDIDIYNKLKEACEPIEKIKLYRNEVNLDCYANKAKAISLASNEYCILFDSDNIMTRDYVTRIYYQTWNEWTILAPVFAKPNFDYREFAGEYITKENVNNFIDKPMFLTALNTHNMFVNRDEYLSCFDDKVNPHTADSIFMNYKWLAKGNNIYFVPELEYEHRVHDGSHYKNNNHLTGNFYDEVVQNIRNFKNKFDINNLVL